RTAAPAAQRHRLQLSVRASFCSAVERAARFNSQGPTAIGPSGRRRLGRGCPCTQPQQPLRRPPAAGSMGSLSAPTNLRPCCASCWQRQRVAELGAGQQPGWRLLHKAAADNRCDVLSVLISSHAELEAQTKNGETALDLALARKSLEALQLLLEEGANANGGANKVESTVHAAVRIRKDDRCGTFDQHGDLPIHRACLEENVRAAQLLLSHNPHLCNRHGARGFTPLHIAANLGNSKLFLTVLRSGPRLDLYDIQERTPIDIVLLAKQDTAILEGMGQWMVSPVLSSGGSCIKELLAMRQGQQFLRLLRTVDNEFQHNFGHNDEKFDINEFVEIVLKACMSGLADEIISGGMVGKIADNFLKHIFVPQNEALLQEVYNQSLGERRKDGIKGLVCRNCLNDEGRVSSLKLHRLVAQLTQFWQLQWVGADDSEAEGDPGHHAWPTGAAAPEGHARPGGVPGGLVRADRPSAPAAPYFLRQEDFDTIPQALLLAKILRSLGRRRDIEDVYANKATKMAITCEGIAMQALRSIKDVDVTPNNCLTMELVMLPLDTFGGYSILEAGGQGRIQQLRHHRHRAGGAEPDDVDAHQGALIELAIALRLRAAAVPAAAVPDAPLRAHEPDLRAPAAQQHQRVIRGTPTAAAGRMRSAPEAPASRAWRCCRAAGSSKSSRRRKQQPRPRLSPLAELLRFYQIPCVKFRMHVTAHISFVLLLSSWSYGPRLLRRGDHLLPDPAGLLVEEINEMITSAREETIKNYFLGRLERHRHHRHHLRFTAFALRIHNSTVHNPFQRYWSLVLLTTTCLVYWVRLLYISVVLESLGPKLKMMSLMVKKDFLPFCSFCAAIPEGKSIQSTGTRRSRERQRDHPRHVPQHLLRHRGEYGLDNFVPCNISDITGPNINDGDEPDCILLLNVIVAMFSKTIDAIDSESKAMWQFEKFDLIEEFKHQVGACRRPSTFLSELRNLASFVWRRLCRRSGGRAGSPPLPLLPREAAANSAAPRQPGDTPHDCARCTCSALYYQALAFRKPPLVPQRRWCWTRRTWTKANKIIFQQVNALNERWRDSTALKRRSSSWSRWSRRLKAISLRGPSNIQQQAASVLAMPYIEEGREGGPVTPFDTRLCWRATEALMHSCLAFARCSSFTAS
uniref:ANK_REP_REGION domain-containing protein n=1 Tax=Macrostomum lignano TaxID=282301 RepID=A0A1I8FD93_9PLAT